MISLYCYGSTRLSKTKYETTIEALVPSVMVLKGGVRDVMAL